MVAFRKWFPVLAITGLTLGSAVTAIAQPTNTSNTLTCNTNAGVPPIVRSEGFTEQVGDLVLDCTGGNPAAPFLTNIQIFLNTNITSRIIDGGSTTEALLMLNDPAPGAQILGTPGVLSGNGNVFRGVKSAQGQNSVVWAGLPITPPGTNHLVIRITNVRANAAGLGVSSTLIPTQIVMFVSASGSTSLAINQPQQTVAFIQQGLLFDIRTCTGGSLPSPAQNLFNQCVAQNSSLFGGSLTSTNTSQFAVRFREGFPTSFKPRFANATSGGVTTSNSPSGLGSVVYGPSTPGVVYNSETGFTNLPVLGSLTGFADNGTRLAARFNNIPAGVRIFVSIGQSTGSSGTLTAGLITTDPNGGGQTSALIPSAITIARCSNTTAGGFDTSSISAAEIPVVNGTALAVWEVLASDPSISETADFAVAIAFAANTANSLPGLGQSTVQGSFAPFYPTTFSTNPTQMQGPGLPIPRFIDNPVNANDFIINTCQTNLLFPFVTNQAGFDTGIAISNTSRDPFGGSSRVQGGTCTLNYYGTTTGGGAAPSAQKSSANVEAGAQLLFVLSSGGNLGIAGTPGFQGYIIAQCQFQYAHGFAFITDGPIGQARVAEGYLALVMDESVGTRTSATSETLGH